MRYFPLLALLLVVGCGGKTDPVRVATFNAALYGEAAGELRASLLDGSEQAEAVAAVVKTVRPDVLMLQEIDPDAVDVFLDRYLAAGEDAIDYPYVYVPATNTGLASGADLDRDGQVGGPGDAHGWGEYPGQYGFALLSRLPIDREGVVTLNEVPWAELPDSRLPAEFYGEAAGVIRLSSKNHVRVPVILPDGGPLHVIAAHPTPPVFDGPEDRNGRRNADEIRLMAELIPQPELAGPSDPEQVGLTPDASPRVRLDPPRFVLVGDLNADPSDGDSLPGAMDVLLNDPRVQDPVPTSPGGPADSARDGGANATQAGDPAADTADFSEPPGNLRVDYVLPAASATVVDAGVYWPADGPGRELVERASDHRLVWADLRFPK